MTCSEAAIWAVRIRSLQLREQIVIAVWQYGRTFGHNREEYHGAVRRASGSFAARVRSDVPSNSLDLRLPAFVIGLGNLLNHGIDDDQDFFPALYGP